MLQPGDHLIRGQRAEAEPGAPGLQSWDDLGQVVADETEASVFCELLDHWKATSEGANEGYRTTQRRLEYSTTHFQEYIHKGYVLI